MPPYQKFKSKAQARGAFTGAFGPRMKEEAEAKAKATGGLKHLPERVGGATAKRVAENAKTWGNAPKRKR